MSWKKKFFLDEIIGISHYFFRITFFVLVIGIPAYLISLFFESGHKMLDLIGSILVFIFGLYLIIVIFQTVINTLAYMTIVIARELFGPSGEEFMKKFWNYTP